MSTKVIFIAGSGRSGSTFLSQLLSQNTDCFNVGQIRDLPASYSKNLNCSCDNVLQACEFWEPVVAEFKSLHGSHALDRFSGGLVAFRNCTNELTKWSDADTRDQIFTENSGFLSLATDLYRIASEQADGAVLVDSSKAPNIALALILAKGISVTVVNLMRDPRAVAASWAKLNNRPRLLRNRCQMWNKRARQMNQIKQIPDQRFIRIKYEDFATSPRTTVGDIQKLANVKQETAFFNGANSAILSWDRTHLFPPANEEVLGSHLEEIKIRPSESWKSDANKPYREIAERINFPLAKRFGY